jgi:hypothetical protein
LVFRASCREPYLSSTSQWVHVSRKLYSSVLLGLSSAGTSERWIQLANCQVIILPSTTTAGTHPRRGIQPPSQDDHLFRSALAARGIFKDLRGLSFAFPSVNDARLSGVGHSLRSARGSLGCTILQRVQLAQVRLQENAAGPSLLSSKCVNQPLASCVRLAWPITIRGSGLFAPSEYILEPSTQRDSALEMATL